MSWCVSFAREPFASPPAPPLDLASASLANRRGTLEEMAKAVLFLASDDSSYFLGSELLVDGGLTQLVNPYLG